MSDTISACQAPRLARQLAICRCCRWPLAIALGALVYLTSRATVDCFSSLRSEREVSQAGRPQAEAAEQAQSPAPPVGENPTIGPDAKSRAPATGASAEGSKSENGDKQPASPVGSPGKTQLLRAGRGLRTAAQRPVGGGLNACTRELLHSLTAVCGRIADQVTGTCRELWTDCAGLVATIERAAHESCVQRQARSKEGRVSATPAANSAVGKPAAAAHAEGLVLLNPARTGGTVLYVLDRQVHSLRPGEKQELPQGLSWRIQFHRGGDFGSADYLLDNGTYTFQTTVHGWDLIRTDDVSASTSGEKAKLRSGEE
jgi:hypothetical protein